MTWKEVIEAWQPVLERLRGEGFVVEDGWFCIGFPVQLTGTLPSGEPFYFRERSAWVSLGIGGTDPVVDPEWGVRFELEESEMSDAFLWPEEAYALLKRLLTERDTNALPTAT